MTFFLHTGHLSFNTGDMRRQLPRSSHADRATLPRRVQSAQGHRVVATVRLGYGAVRASADVRATALATDTGG